MRMLKTGSSRRGSNINLKLRTCENKIYVASMLQSYV